MKLFIVESPGKVRKLQAFLGHDWKVAASVGHVRDLPIKDIGVRPPDFKPVYKPTTRGVKVISDLRSLAASADSVWLATDPDREGEAIAWHLKEALGLRDPMRVTFSEITEKAVKAALEKPGRIDLDLVRAQEGRRVLDRIVGYKVSPALGNLIGQRLSAGRVQTPAVRLVVEREQAIRAFVPAKYFIVEAFFDAGDSKFWKAVFRSAEWLPQGAKYFQDREAANLAASIKNFTVMTYEEGEVFKAPPAPFTTSTLQQAASNALKMDPKRTMELAQGLYEGGHVTYIRTDNPNISDEAAQVVRSYCQDKGWPVPEKPRKFKSGKDAQEAHEAIRPTHPEIEEAGDNGGERALYNLIRTRALASQMEDAKFQAVKVALKGDAGGREAMFDGKGSRLVSPGWRKALGGDQADETDGEDEALNNPIPVLEAGAGLEAVSNSVKSKTTSAPPRFTQAALIRELEKRGIGRPSTYASIMDNISRRGYVNADKSRKLSATPLGEEVILHLKARFKFAGYEFTRDMEAKLDGVAKGEADYLSIVREAYAMIENEIKEMGTGSGHECPDCGKELRHLVREGVYDFWACSDRDQCGAKFENDGGKPGVKNSRPPLSEHKCQACGKPLRHIVKEGQWDFWGCSDRECGASYSDNGGMPGEMKPKKAPPSKFKCQQCGRPLYHRKGVSQKTGKEYDFFSCSDRSCGKTYNADGDQPVFTEKRAGGGLSGRRGRR